MSEARKTTGFDAGLSGDDQIRLVLQRIVDRGGEAEMADLYAAVEDRLGPMGLTLSDQGRASLRFFVNNVAVKAGYLHPHDRTNPGWRITAEGREFAGSPAAAAQVAVNVDTGSEEQVPSNAAQGAAFERWVLLLLRAAYPHYAWYDQGRHKHNERGLDFVGARIGDSKDEPRSIGVQVKLHQPNNAPAQAEWLKFLAGCFTRRVDRAMFITTGRLTGEQRRESQEASVIVIEGASEILRMASLHGVERFDLSERETDLPG
jgi:hypothetical protein